MVSRPISFVSFKGDYHNRRLRSEAQRLGPKLKVGDWVEVRSKEEIIATLDAGDNWKGCRSCQKCSGFVANASKSTSGRTRRATLFFPFEGAMSIEVCISRLDAMVPPIAAGLGVSFSGKKPGSSLLTVSWIERFPFRQPAARQQILHHAQSRALMRLRNVSMLTGTPVYSCQATQLPYLTSDLNWWDIRQYIEATVQATSVSRRIGASFQHAFPIL